MSVPHRALPHTRCHPEGQSSGPKDLCTPRHQVAVLFHNEPQCARFDTISHPVPGPTSHLIITLIPAKCPLPEGARWPISGRFCRKWGTCLPPPDPKPRDQYFASRSPFPLCEVSCHPEGQSSGPKDLCTPRHQVVVLFHNEPQCARFDTISHPVPGPTSHLIITLIPAKCPLPEGARWPISGRFCWKWGTCLPPPDPKPRDQYFASRSPFPLL